jgi:formate C-acetyltransferase
MAWTRRLAAAADDRAMTEDDPERRENLVEMARVCYKIAEAKPETFREVVQWIAVFNMASRTYNRDGAGGQLDELLRPYYERDRAAGILTDEDAEFYVFCLLLNDPHYYQIGGPSADGKDQTSRMSYIILEAANKLKSSCNLTIRVWDGMDRGLFRRGVEILLANRLGFPRFSGDKALVEGFMKNGYSAELARSRIAVGCNWMSLPGLEYTREHKRRRRRKDSRRAQGSVEVSRPRRARNGLHGVLQLAFPRLPRAGCEAADKGGCLKCC